MVYLQRDSQHRPGSTQVLLRPHLTQSCPHGLPGSRPRDCSRDVVRVSPGPATHGYRPSPTRGSRRRKASRRPQQPGEGPGPSPPCETAWLGRASVPRSPSPSRTGWEPCGVLYQGPRRTGERSRRTARCPNERQSKVSGRQNERPVHVHVRETAKNPREGGRLSAPTAACDAATSGEPGPRTGPRCRGPWGEPDPVLPATTPGYSASPSPAPRLTGNTLCSPCGRDDLSSYESRVFTAKFTVQVKTELGLPVRTWTLSWTRQPRRGG